MTKRKEQEDKSSAGKTNAAYDKLKARFADIKNIRNVVRILVKDQEVSMPCGAREDRARQFEILSRLGHRLLNDHNLRRWLDKAEAGAQHLSPQDRRNLQLMREEYENGAMPEDLAAEKARLEGEGSSIHSAVKKSANWLDAAHWYQHSFDTQREIGRDKMQRRGFNSIYEALLDNFSPGISEDLVERELGRLERSLPKLINAVIDKQKQEPVPIPLSGPFPKEQQRELCRRIVEAIGFDFDHGRFDMIDGHPSSGGTSDDVRFTTRHDEGDFLQALYSTIHEAGHALYDQNQPKDWRYQPAGGHLGMAVHESQSRIMEVQACMTPEFFEFLEKEARDVFNRPNDPALAADNLRRLKHKIEPSLIRIYADELTYPVHIILRHQLEKAIINETLKVKDLPKAWADGMQKLLHLTPPDDAQGCLQDVHWPIGSVGYFPAYTLGDMGAAQLFAAACRNRPEIRSELKTGNFKPLREWLRDHIQSKGALLTAEQLFTDATGEKLNARHYIEHLSQRYLGCSYRTAFQPAPPKGPEPAP